MGQRGRLPRSPAVAAKLGKPSHGSAAKSTALVVSRSAVPALPVEMSSGAATWREAWSAPWISPDRDGGLVRALVTLEIEAAGHREVLEREGWTLTEAIADPRGGVLAERIVPHPREAMLRRCEKQMLELRKLLALSPVGAARIGLDLLHGRKETTVLESMLAEEHGRKSKGEG